jgi:hypothetical protein
MRLTGPETFDLRFDESKYEPWDGGRPDKDYQACLPEGV